jgi:hypothetical protein
LRREEGEGDGESLCLPLLDGKGDLKDDGGGRLGADGTVNGLGLCAVDVVAAAAVDPDEDAFDDVDAVRVDDEDELEARVSGWNHVVGLFNPLDFGTLNADDPVSILVPDILDPILYVLPSIWLVVVLRSMY